jgi:hypothetical protein
LVIDDGLRLVQGTLAAPATAGPPDFFAFLVLLPPLVLPALVSAVRVSGCFAFCGPVKTRTGSPSLRSCSRFALLLGVRRLDRNTE